MKSLTRRHIVRIASSNRRNRSRIMLLSALDVLLVLCVGLVLRQNGRAATGQEQVLSCPVTGTVAHHHDDSCYDAEGNLVCTLPEVERHVHDDSCYQEQRTLACGQEETAGHTHDDSCYDEEGNLTCGQEESAGHVHDDSCYRTERTLACGREEVTEEHQHGPGCFAAAAEMPEQAFEHRFVDGDNKEVLTVLVDAPEGALPEGTTMEAKWVDTSKKKNAEVKAVVEETVAKKTDAEVAQVQAVDITFRDADGDEVEPARKVTVTFASPQIAEDGTSQLLVHVESDREAQERAGRQGKSTYQIEGSVIEPLTAKQLEKRDLPDEADELVFDADQFSVYAVVYTVDFHWEVDGKTYDFSIPGGGFVSLRDLVQTLGIAGDGSAENEAEIFVDNVDNVTFSDPDLVWVEKAEADTTVGFMKDAAGLECTYSASLSQEELTEIDTQNIGAGDWALISLRPFSSEETLSVSMKNGDLFTVNVKDEQISTSVMTADGKNYRIDVIYGPEAELPEGAVLKAEEIVSGDAAYEEYVAKTAEAVGSTAETLGYIRLFDIRILDASGQKVEPAAPVQVKIEYDSPAQIDVHEDIQVVHFAEDGPEVIEPETNRDRTGAVDEFVFETDSFSFYSIISQESGTGLVGKSYLLVTAGNVALLGQKHTLSTPAKLVGTWVNPKVGGTLQVNGTAALWSFEAVEGQTGWYYISDGKGQYLNLDDNKNLTLGMEPQAFYVDTRTSGNTVQYQIRTQENGGLAVNNYGHSANNGFAGWDAGNGNNEWFLLYGAEYLGDYRVYFNKNGGSDPAPATMYGTAGNTITLPDYTGTKEGYTFIGWSTGKNLASNTYYPVYPVGSEYTVPDEDTTLYAVWTSNTPATAEFYIRLDGTIPYEPDQYDGSAYTGKITIKEAVKNRIWVTDNDTTKPNNGVNVINNVTANLNSVPNVDQLVANINASYTKLGFKVANEDGEIVVTQITNAGTNSQNYNVSEGDALYVLWYVQKYAGGWHVDGVLLAKNRVKISYDGNTTDGSAKNIPLGYQTAPGTQVTIGASGSASGTVKTPTRTGYNFLGWNTEKDGSGTEYQNNVIYTLNEDTTLYAQWSKGTNLMTVYKTNSENEPLAGAKFKLEEKNDSGSYIEKAIRTTGETGIFTYDTLENDTLYRMTETYAPNGYEMRNSFFFKVDVDSESSGTLAVHVSDADGNHIDAPAWLTIDYTRADDPSALGVARIRFEIKDEKILRKVTFIKTDDSEDSTPLPGAVFKLENAEGEVSGVLKEQSGENGVFSMDNAALPYGIYTLSEIKAPDNYQTCRPITFTLNDYVSETDNGLKITDGDAAASCTVTTETADGVTVTTYSYTVTVKDAKIPSVPVVLKKIGYNNTNDSTWNLKGAVFKIYADPDRENPVELDGKKEFTSGKDGVIYEGSLDLGTYYLDETGVPDGYYGPAGMYILKVEATGVSLNSTAASGSPDLSEWIAAAEDAETHETVYTVSICNTIGVSLPSTGGPGTKLLYLLGVMLMMIAAAGGIFAMTVKRSDR